ncbi:MAG TPA: RNA 2',3'-cyclic phosphodiesterase [Acidobacteriaceae bacterium]|nr:RNA 2',3'-cyclic phosphodiesterase [Acidobacteriaceae bacterium]
MPVTLSLMRLFAALPLPPDVVERLLNLRLRFSTVRDGLRWSTPEQWHITLQFFGDVHEEQAACLQAGLKRLEGYAPLMVLEELGLFPAKGILYVGVEPSPSLLSLHRQVVTVAASCGLEEEPRAFRPHITLARSKGREGHATLRKLSTPHLPAFGPKLGWSATECVLLESTLRPEGSVYTVRARVPLGDQPEANGGV